MLGVDLSGLRLDGAARPTICPPTASGRPHEPLQARPRPRRSRKADHPRSSCSRLAGGRGHRVIAGTPEQIADQIEDGSRRAPPTASTSCRRYLPGGLEAFVDHVVPILQQRGLFRTEYAGRPCATTTAWPGPPASTAPGYPHDPRGVTEFGDVQPRPGDGDDLRDMTDAALRPRSRAVVPGAGNRLRGRRRPRCSWLGSGPPRRGKR